MDINIETLFESPSVGGNVSGSIYKQTTAESNGSTLTIDTSTQSSSIKLLLNTPEVTLTLTEPEIGNGEIKQMTLVIEQGTGANKIIWPSNIHWPYNRKPVLSFTVGKKDLVGLTYDGNNNWLGQFVSGGF